MQLNILNILLIVGAFSAGVVLSYLFFFKRFSTLSVRKKQLEETVEELKNERKRLEDELVREREERVRAQTRLSEMQRLLEEERKAISEAEKRLLDAFKALSSDVLKSNSAMFLQMAKEALDSLIIEAKGDFERRNQAIEQAISPISEALKRFEKEIKELEIKRETAYQSIREQIENLSRKSEELRMSAEKLASALGTPKVKGKWGEVALKNLVELSGLSDYCDFSEQSFITTYEGSYRPDMVIRLPGDKFVVVDAKTPVDHYLRALEVESEDEKKRYLELHAKALKDHVKRLADKSYWRKIGRSPDFVVMFLPAEAFFSAALEVDKGLIEEGVKNGVIIATPTILVALLKVIALSWREYILSENIRNLVDVGKELGERINRFLSHLGDVGKKLEGAVGAYNRAVGSWYSRVEPSFRKFGELCGVKDMKSIESIETTVKRISGEKDG